MVGEFRTFVKSLTQNRYRRVSVSFVTTPKIMDEAHELEEENDHHHVLSLLKALKKASKDLQTNPISDMVYQNDSKAAIKALLELGTKADAIIAADPTLLNLSLLLSNLKNLLEKLEKLQGYSLRSFFCRPITKYKIFQIAYAIEAEIQSYIDRDTVVNLPTTLRESSEEDEQLRVLIEFRNRVSHGFDRDFQELVLRGRVFSVLESVLSESITTYSKRVRNEAALLVLALVEFNKDVFVGLVLMGPAIRALITIASSCSIRVLSSLIRYIKTPLVDEIESNGEIRRIIDLLSSEHFPVRIAAMDCVLEIAFFGRKEVIESMIEEDLVTKLMNLQRTIERERGSIESGRPDESDTGRTKLKRNPPCENCVARFAVQIQVGEGLEKREKGDFKSIILKMVREASVSDAEAAATVAEVLWGSSS